MGIGHEHCRCVKIFSGRHRIAEQSVIDTHHETGLIILVQLNFRQEAARIHKRKSVAGAILLIGHAVAQSDERILLVGGNAASAADLMDVMSQRLPLNLALLAVSARKRDQVHIGAVHVIHIQRHDPLEVDGPVSSIVDSGRAHDNIRLFKHRVKKRYLYLCDRVFNDKFQCINCVVFIRERCRKSFQCERTFVHLVRAVSSVKRKASVRILHLDGIDPEVALLLRGKLLRLGIERKSALRQ